MVALMALLFVCLAFAGMWLLAELRLLEEHGSRHEPEITLAWSALFVGLLVTGGMFVCDAALLMTMLYFPDLFGKYAWVAIGLASVLSVLVIIGGVILRQIGVNTRAELRRPRQAAH